MPAVFKFLLGLVAATALYALCVRLDARLATLVDPFLVLVVVHGLRSGPSSSALAGTVAGLAQDAVTGGLYGLHGFANTLVAWTVAKVQQRMMIQQLLQMGLVGLLASALQLAMLASLQFMVAPQADMPRPGHVAVRIVVTGLLVVATRWLVDRALRAENEWREKRRSRLRLGT